MRGGSKETMNKLHHIEVIYHDDECPAAAIKRYLAEQGLENTRVPVMAIPASWKRVKSKRKEIT